MIHAQRSRAIPGMTDQLNVVEFDRDEAVAEAIDGIEEERARAPGCSRAPASFAGAGGMAALLAGLASARNGGTKANDIKILNYALTLEYLEAAFYAEALRVGGYTGAVGTLRVRRRQP